MDISTHMKIKVNPRKEKRENALVYAPTFVVYLSYVLELIFDSEIVNND